MMEIVKVLQVWDDGGKTILGKDGNEWYVPPNPNAEITAYDYPKLNQNRAHEYVTGMVEKGNGKSNKTGVKYYQQNGYKYDRTGKSIIGTGKHVK